MSISQPSREIYVIDVPEIKQFDAIYHYNFFVPDESVNETGGVPSNILVRPGGEIDSHFIQFSVTRVPRFVEFRWTKPRLADVGNELSERALRDNVFRTTGEQDGSLILKNIDKIIHEDDFSSNHFASVHFHDGEIENKIHELVSGTLVQRTLEEERPTNVSHYKAAHKLLPNLPGYLNPHWIFKALTHSRQAYGATFYLPGGSDSTQKARSGAMAAGMGTRVVDNFFQRLHRVSTNVQMNTKLMHDMVNRTIKDPNATNAADLMSMHQYSKSAKQAANQRFSTALSEQDFKTFVPFIQVKKQGDSAHQEKYGSQIVGYIIDKFEVLEDGSTREHPPIIIDNPHIHTSADFRVKFNANYCYTIRTIALLTMPAIDDDSGDVATVKVLVSSKPSNKIYVSTLNQDAPPPPANLNFVWNYETNRLMVTWNFPTNSHQDIKKFQVFRRQSVDDSFELQKVYDFNDSLAPFPPVEEPDVALVEKVRSPATFWIDDEFNWELHTSREKGLIYAAACIDAHELTSNYSAQYLVWFDRFKNQLQKVLISHAGAPKPYPNLYLEGTLFENTIRVQGNHSRRMRVYFNPEYYYLTDDRNRYVKVLQTKQTGGSYRLQFINVDNLKSANLDITIDDRTLASSRRIAYPTVQFGPKRKPNKDQRR